MQSNLHFVHRHEYGTDGHIALDSGQADRSISTFLVLLPLLERYKVIAFPGTM